MNDQEESALVQSRLLKMFLLGVVCVSFVGFFVGTRSGVESSTLELSHSLDVSQEIEQEPLTWPLEVVDGVVGDGFEVTLAPLPLRSVESRWENRAYSGAPPTIPHVVNQSGALACLACHAEGLRVRDRYAPAISHRELEQCTQCHVVSEAPMPGAKLGWSEALKLSRFTPFRAKGGGARAWATAPPVIPHDTEMRSQCLSCHGKVSGFASSHPERTNCLQCHAAGRPAR